MGFFDSLIGGSESSSSSSTQYSLPVQRGFNQLAGQTREFVSPKNPENIERFRPIGITDDEQLAFDRIRQGIAPQSSEDVRSMVDMFYNPYGDVILDNIDRDFEGQNSLLKGLYSQTGSGPGASGSNRSILDTVNLEEARLNSKAAARKDMYDSALNTALGRYSDLKYQDIASLLGIGGFERSLDLETKQAPVSALKVMSQILNPLTSTQTSQSSSSSSDSDGILGSLSNAAASYYAAGA